MHLVAAPDLDAHEAPLDAGVVIGQPLFLRIEPYRGLVPLLRRCPEGEADGVVVAPEVLPTLHVARDDDLDGLAHPLCLVRLDVAHQAVDLAFVEHVRAELVQAKLAHRRLPRDVHLVSREAPEPEGPEKTARGATRGVPEVHDVEVGMRIGAGHVGQAHDCCPLEHQVADAPGPLGESEQHRGLGLPSAGGEGVAERLHVEQADM
mmetsp:Transcript_13212/g.38073  ORF Transcript_13212/g.38073 Transcript_13212/m.38073 type:complete len:206 (-) Transcript_13212:875-1492(-)